MTDKLAWGILSTGKIAHAFARALPQSQYGRAVAVASRSLEPAQRFAEQHGIPRAYGTYQALLDDPAVQAVYIAPPHPMHAEWAIKAAQAGKHILCEKPLAMNHAEALRVVEAARRHDVFLMEAFMYRCHPQTQRLVELVMEGTIGDVRVIQATFSFGAAVGSIPRIFRNDLGGGGILNVGCYCASMARLIAGAAHGRDFAEPRTVTGCASLAPEGVAHTGRVYVDHIATAGLLFPDDIVANLSTGIIVNQENVLRIFGTKGHIYVPEPWAPSREGGTSYIYAHLQGETERRKIAVQADRWLFAIEADTVAEHIPRRQALWPAMTWDDTLGNMRTLDAWRAAVGVTYEADRQR